MDGGEKSHLFTPVLNTLLQIHLKFLRFAILVLGLFQKQAGERTNLPRAAQIPLGDAVLK